jgi:hypothetical protein
MTETRDWRAYFALLAAQLKERHMSQAAFARLCGCSPSHVSQCVRLKYPYVPKYMWQAARTHLGLRLDPWGDPNASGGEHAPTDLVVDLPDDA